MNSFLRNILLFVAWLLIAIGLVLGLWMVWDMISGVHTFLGGPIFVIRQWLGLIAGGLAPVALGGALLVAVRIYDRVTEAKS
ncbi:hypothetical protein [Brevundimonas bullata]